MSIKPIHPKETGTRTTPNTRQDARAVRAATSHERTYADRRPPSPGAGCACVCATSFASCTCARARGRPIPRTPPHTEGQRRQRHTSLSSETAPRTSGQHGERQAPRARRRPPSTMPQQRAVLLSAPRLSRGRSAQSPPATSAAGGASQRAHSGVNEMTSVRLTSPGKTGSVTVTSSPSVMSSESGFVRFGRVAYHRGESASARAGGGGGRGGPCRRAHPPACVRVGFDGCGGASGGVVNNARWRTANRKRPAPRRAHPRAL